MYYLIFTIKRWKMRKEYRFPHSFQGSMGLRCRAKRRGVGWRPISPQMTGGTCFSHALASWVARLTKKREESDAYPARSLWSSWTSKRPSPEAWILTQLFWNAGDCAGGGGVEKPAGWLANQRLSFHSSHHVTCEKSLSNMGALTEKPTGVNCRKRVGQRPSVLFSFALLLSSRTLWWEQAHVSPKPFIQVHANVEEIIC